MITGNRYLDMTVGTLEVGDRVEVTRRCDDGDVFGIVIDVTDGRQVKLRLVKGGELSIDRSKLAHAPDPETIRLRCQLIQQTWCNNTSLSRAGLNIHSLRNGTVELSEVHDQWDASLAEYGRIDR